MKLITIDLETTGLDLEKDEILQISIIDEKYNTLMNQYCKPEKIQEWKEAEVVHGITPDMVKDELPFKTKVCEVQDMIRDADRIIVYNGKGFDLQLLQRYGIEIDYSKVYDLMLEVDRIYHRWFKLVELAEFYGYEFKAHDSLEDTKATLYCYYKFRKEQSNKFFDYKSIDFIIEHSNKKEQAKSIEVKEDIDTICLENHVLISTTTNKEYQQKILFNNRNLVVDSQCDCLDCLDGGNRLCKHVIAALIYLKNERPNIYEDARRAKMNYLHLKKEHMGN